MGRGDETELADASLSGTYAVEGDTLFITTTEEETVEFHRI